MQTYLVSNKLNSSNANFIFKIRTCLLGVKTNFKEKFKNNLSCQVCLSHTDTQEGIQFSSQYWKQDNQVYGPILPWSQCCGEKRNTTLKQNSKLNDTKSLNWTYCAPAMQCASIWSSCDPLDLLPVVSWNTFLNALKF